MGINTHQLSVWVVAELSLSANVRLNALTDGQLASLNGGESRYRTEGTSPQLQVKHSICTQKLE